MGNDNDMSTTERTRAARGGCSQKGFDVTINSRTVDVERLGDLCLYPTGKEPLALLEQQLGNLPPTIQSQEVPPRIVVAPASRVPADRLEVGWRCPVHCCSLLVQFLVARF